MVSSIRLLDPVALIQDIASQSLLRGQVGTVVELLDDDHVEVEFTDDEGRAYACLPVPISSLIVLRYLPAKVA
jgi:hypothetical protein